MGRTERAVLFAAGLDLPLRPHPIDALAMESRVIDAARSESDQLADLRARVAEAVNILQSFRHNDEARQEAFKALTGAELLIQVGEGS